MSGWDSGASPVRLCRFSLAASARLAWFRHPVLGDFLAEGECRCCVSSVRLHSYSVSDCPPSARARSTPTTPSSSGCRMERGSRPMQVARHDHRAGAPDDREQREHAEREREKASERGPATSRVRIGSRVSGDGGGYSNLFWGGTFAGRPVATGSTGRPARTGEPALHSVLRRRGLPLEAETDGTPKGNDSISVTIANLCSPC